jgi:cytochrome c oxidase subunit 2
MSIKSMPLVVACLGLLAFSLREPVHAAQSPQAVQIKAHRFAFSPNEVTVKVNQTAVLMFQSDDVTHGMHFDDLDINAVIEKGKGATVTFTPKTVGDFIGHCAVFCGNGHGDMAFTIHVVE